MGLRNIKMWEEILSVIKEELQNIDKEIFNIMVIIELKNR